MVVDEASPHKVSEAGDLGPKAKQLSFVATVEGKGSGASDSAVSLALFK